MLYLSLGENCLSDDILSRFGLKSYATPYSHGRSNIDYILEMERNNFENLLCVNYLAEEFFSKKPVIRSKAYNTCENIFNATQSNGFEFTHHDVIRNELHKDSYCRKVQRMQDARGSEDITFLYHHRISSRSNMPMLREKLVGLSKLYSQNGMQCKVALFYQNIKSTKERSVKIFPQRDNLLEFEFYTEHEWRGSDNEIFWARVDNDLLEMMIRHIKSISEPLQSHF